MKRIMMLGAVSAVMMTMGTTGFAACHFAGNMRNGMENNRGTAAYAVSGEAAEEYSCVFVDDNQDGICDNCHGDHGVYTHDNTHHNFYYHGGASGNADSETYDSMHHSERHGWGHHHR